MRPLRRRRQVRERLNLRRCSCSNNRRTGGSASGPTVDLQQVDLAVHWLPGRIGVPLRSCVTAIESAPRFVARDPVLTASQDGVTSSPRIEPKGQRLVGVQISVAPEGWSVQMVGTPLPLFRPGSLRGERHPSGGERAAAGPRNRCQRWARWLGYLFRLNGGKGSGTQYPPAVRQVNREFLPRGLSPGRQRTRAGGRRPSALPQCLSDRASSRGGVAAHGPSVDLASVSWPQCRTCGHRHSRSG